ncbi:MAG: NTP transferase domain-containing protein [Alphaproteobacteria bacterium]|nr:NTP transferase domain-containing protein [Alphaproteobacteria bacterium]
MRKAVVVAAGHGTRFLPITRVVPKELLPVLARPALDLVLDELVRAGFTDLLLVGSARKQALERWLVRDPELDRALAARPALAPLLEPPALRARVVHQARMGGTGDAILHARDFAGDDAVLVVFPDDLFDPRGPNPSGEVWSAHEATGHAVLGAVDLTGRDVSAYGVIDAIGDGPVRPVRGIVEKPAPGAEPSHLVSVGRYVYTPALLDALARSAAHHGEGELYPMAAMTEVADQGALSTAVLTGRRWDTGTPLGLLEATLDLALDDPDTAEAVAGLLHARADRAARILGRGQG